jgi:hypothetical protein
MRSVFKIVTFRSVEYEVGVVPPRSNVPVSKIEYRVGDPSALEPASYSVKFEGTNVEIEVYDAVEVWWK